MNRVAKIERSHQLGEIIGVGVQVLSSPRLTRSSMTSAIVRDAPIAASGKKYHLIFEGVGVERPPMAEHDWLTGAPILVIELGAVFGRDLGHLMTS